MPAGRRLRRFAVRRARGSLLLCAGRLEVAARRIVRAGLWRRRGVASRGISVRFIHGDALRLAELGETFDTVTDSGLLHVLSDQQMTQVIPGLHSVLRPSGYYWLMCFNQQATLSGPRRLTKHRIAILFKDGWTVHSIQHARFQVVPGRGYENIENGAAAWLAGIERLRAPCVSGWDDSWTSMSGRPSRQGTASDARLSSTTADPPGGGARASVFQASADVEFEKAR
jgi:methyltransferase family protein